MFKKISFILILYGCLLNQAFAQSALESFNYVEDFEDRELGAWASYPLWQDTAYDPNFRVGEIIPRDDNISIVQKVTPYTNVDNYAGAQKLMNIFLGGGAEISLRYYIKSNLTADFFKVRFAAGDYGKLDITIANPKMNEWGTLTVTYEDLMRENPALKDKGKIEIHALAFLTKIVNADPAMPIYLGLDDITVKAEQNAAFEFAEPTMFKLPEFAAYIPKHHYNAGDDFNLNGSWGFDAEHVTIEIASFTDQDKIIYKGTLNKNGDGWSLDPLKLSYPNGLYRAKVTAYYGTNQLSQTEFTIHIAPKAADMAGKHPRLLYDGDKKKWLDQRFSQSRFKKLYDDLVINARNQREKVPLDNLIFDLDQFPDENWIHTWYAWLNHIFYTANSLRANAMAYAFHDDRQAGQYAKDMLLKFSNWDNWSHPWQTDRGRYSEHSKGSWSHRIAEAYDLTYDLMSEEEREKIRKAIFKNIIKAGYQTHVYNDNITSKTSNWIAMITGGSLMNMAAIYGDGADVKNLEPYFTATMMKYYAFLNRVTDSKDGSWGEGLGYNSYSMSNLAYSVPSLKNVFNIDVSAPLVGSYNEYIWAGLLKDRKWFDFGDSTGEILPVSNWAFLLDMQKEPRLGWYYNYLKNNEPDPDSDDYFKFINEADANISNQTFQDVLYETEHVVQDTPFDESPVKVFHDVGTTVFKSGWEKDDFVFVMRSGAFYNHQHLDQGSFYLADKGNIFIEDRHLSTSDYYDDPLYQSWLTQPVAHSTILINGNHQSQRVGDPLKFAHGFDDHAFIGQFLDGTDVAFSSGDIGRLYWNKVKSLTRNVLYLKPRTILMIDIAVPNEEDVDVNLLYQTMKLEDINVGQNISTISKGGERLNILHLTPTIAVKAVETPHYLKTLLNDKPLIKEGMITATARTDNLKPLVMANLLITDDVAENITSEVHAGYVRGTASGQNFAYSTKPDNIYKIENMKTDAVAISWNDQRIFVASATSFSRDGSVLLSAEVPVTFELSGDVIKYYHNRGGELILGSALRPSSIMLNGTLLNDFSYDEAIKIVRLQVPQGEGIIVIN